MRDQSVQHADFRRDQLLTSGDVARVIDRTRQGVRWLVLDGQLTGEQTESGQRLFRLDEVLRLVDRRAKARLKRVHVLRPRRFNVRGEASQLPLFSPAGLTDRQVHHAESGASESGSDKRSPVT